jgi:hypothetical protein
MIERLSLPEEDIFYPSGVRRKIHNQDVLALNESYEKFKHQNTNPWPRPDYRQ